MRLPVALSLVTLLNPVGSAVGQSRRAAHADEPAPVRDCLDRDMILMANDLNHQTRGAPFWVDKGHEFELLGEREMLSDLEQHIGHEMEITLLLEWESNNGPRPIPEPTAPGPGFPGPSGGVNPGNPGLPGGVGGGRGGFGGQPGGPAGQPQGFGQPSNARIDRAVRASAIPEIMTEFRVISLACRSDRLGR